MHPISPLASTLPLLCGLVLFTSGCVSSKYQFHGEPRRAAALHLRAEGIPEHDTITPAPLEAVLHSVIVLRGPGSWKKNAYWDEYVLTLVNRSATPVTIESATLTDFQSQMLRPGTEPWALEKQSRDFESRIAGTAGDVLKIGGGVFVAGGAGVATGTALAVAGSAGTWTAMGIAGGAMIAAVPVYAVGTVYRNVSSKRRIEEEFQARSLDLPLTLSPHQPTEGSLFFRICPGPQRLALRYRTNDGTAHDLVFSLEPLAGLHLKSPTPASASLR